MPGFSTTSRSANDKQVTKALFTSVPRLVWGQAVAQGISWRLQTAQLRANSEHKAPAAFQRLWMRQ